jgi:hypothetical protein
MQRITWNTESLPSATLAALALSTAVLFALWLPRSPAPELPFAGEGGEVRAKRAYGELPLAFEPNAGRSEPGVDFISRSASGTVSLSDDGATLALGSGKRAEAIGLELTGATPAKPAALERLPGIVNDLRGDDPARWRTEIPTFERVRYPGVWPGIDLDYYGNQRLLEYDLRLAPGADPNQIAIQVAGADRLRLAPNGDLLISAGTETIRQQAPVAYQPSGGASQPARTPVRAAFALSGDTVLFRLGAYDQARPLVIDPVVLAYSTYLGGNAFDQGTAIAVDSAGAAYVIGDTNSSDFNTMGPIEGDTPGSTDVFVSKLTPAGSALAYSTYLGGDGDDNGFGIAVDSSGAAYVTGQTNSSDFNTMGPIEGDSADTDAFISKLNAAGSALAYSTYLGGDAIDAGTGIAVDSAGAAYVTGRTASSDFDTVGEIEGDSAVTDAFVSKLTAAGNALAYSTYLGGNGADFGNGIAVDSAGAAYLTGRTFSTDFNTVDPIEGDTPDGVADVFVSKLNAAGNALAYSTYLGGNSADDGTGIAVDSAGAAYVTGRTSSTDFNTMGPVEGNSASADVFVSKLTAAGNALAYSTYLGGNGDDFGNGIAVNSSGAAYVTGGTDSTDFDTVGEIEGDSALRDAFVSRLTAAGSALDYSTYLGGGSDDFGSGIAVDTAGGAYVTGGTDSTDFDTLGEIEGDSAFSDAFVSKLVACSITGTAGNDRLKGTNGDDVICGLGGNDRINGRGGNDILDGGDDDDQLIGGPQVDALRGGAGGNDRANYAEGATTGVEVDLSTGVVANDGQGFAETVATVEIVEGAKNQTNALAGDSADNRLFGGALADQLVGGGGADTLGGEGDDDQLDGGDGGDALFPGLGSNTATGGTGSDTLQYTGLGTPAGVVVDNFNGSGTTTGAASDTFSEIENVTGTPNADTITVDWQGDVSLVRGRDGDDFLSTQDGDTLDTMNGGAGADTCANADGDVVISCP